MQCSYSPALPQAHYNPSCQNHSRLPHSRRLPDSKPAPASDPDPAPASMTDRPS